MTLGSEPGFFGVAHRPFTPGDQAEASLRLPAGMSRPRLAEREALLAELGGVDPFQRQAFDMIASGRVREALSLKREGAEALERYSGAETLLKARRLVEAGVGCVTVSLGSWDTHKNNFNTLKDLLPVVDRGLSALVQDLHDRGLAGDVVVLAWGEFGRTPKVNAEAGRDHWTPVMSAVLAGGGLKTGQVVGATDRRGERPARTPCTVQSVLATVYRAIGIDPRAQWAGPGGRPLPLLDDPQPIRELM